MLTKSCVFLMLLGPIFANPFLYNAPQALTSFVSSASAASSGSVGNIAQVRAAKLQDDDDFFKESQENDQNQNAEEEMKNEAAPGLIQKKINKIVQKIRFLAMLTNSGTPNNDDEFQKEQDEFNREYEQDFGREDLTEGSGYFYDKPNKVQKSAKQVSESKFSVNPGDIGVFFMELIGSLVGLAYGAAAQLNFGGSTTASP